MLFALWSMYLHATIFFCLWDTLSDDGSGLTVDVDLDKVLILIWRSGHAEWYKMTPPSKKLKRIHHPALSNIAIVTITTVITIVIAISRDINVIKKEADNIYKTKNFQ
jgi:hypothetical protein